MMNCMVENHVYCNIAWLLILFFETLRLFIFTVFHVLAITAEVINGSEVT
jgi:hypothetical protein